MFRSSPFLFSRFFLFLYIIRFILIAGSDQYSSFLSSAGELAIGAFFIDLLFSKVKIDFNSIKELSFYLFFLLLMFFSVFWYANGTLYLFDIFSKYLLFFIVFLVVVQTQKIDFIFLAILIGCLIIFILAYEEIMVYTVNPVNKRFTFTSLDDQGGINPNALAFYCTISIGFLIYKYKIIQQKIGKITILGLIGVLAYIVLFVTLSRKGVIGLAIMYLYFIYSDKNGRFYYFSLIVLSGIFLAFTLEHYNIAVFDRFISTINLFGGNEGKIGQSDSERSYLFFEALEFWTNKPVLGNGINYMVHNSSLRLYSHNNFTELLVSFGILGLISFYTPILRSLYKNFYSLNQPNRIDIFFIFILVFFLVSDLAMVSYYNVVYLSTLGCILGYKSPVTKLL